MSYQEQAIAFFKEKSETVSIDEHGVGVIEVYIELLSRVGRYKEAIDASKYLEPHEEYLSGLAPSLHELCHASGNFAPMLERCRQSSDILGYATALCSTKPTKG